MLPRTKPCVAVLAAPLAAAAGRFPKERRLPCEVTAGGSAHEAHPSRCGKRGDLAPGDPIGNGR